KRRIFGKKQQTSHVGSRWTPRGIHQMIRVSENNLRRPKVLRPGCQMRDGSVVQVVPGSVHRLVPFVKHVSFGFSESLDLLGGKRYGLSRDAIKGAPAIDTIEFDRRRHVEFDEQEIAESVCHRGYIERGSEQCLGSLDQALDLVGFVRNSRDATVGFNTDQKRSAVGIGHAGENAYYFTCQFFISFLLG